MCNSEWYGGPTNLERNQRERKRWTKPTHEFRQSILGNLSVTMGDADDQGPDFVFKSTSMLQFRSNALAVRSTSRFFWPLCSKPSIWPCVHLFCCLSQQIGFRRVDVLSSGYPILQLERLHMPDFLVDQKIG